MVASLLIFQLLTVRPSDNALTLVYVGPDTASFVQYINHSAKPIPISTVDVHCVNAVRSTEAFAYDLALTYYEPLSDVQSEAEVDATEVPDESPWNSTNEDLGSDDEEEKEDEDDGDTGDGASDNDDDLPQDGDDEIPTNGSDR